MSNDALSWRLEDFEQLATLGTGTFGRVRLVRNRSSGRYYAMKILRKSEIIRLKQVEHIRSEKAVLLEVQHPFIVQLHRTFQDRTCLYMVMDYACGGEVFSHLRKAGRFTNDVARVYAAEIVLALEALHARDIVYRDLKPENLLLDERGHIKITDFGFAKKVVDRTWTLCGTPEYLAPEIIQSKGHGKAVDWWAVGILIYEMLVGYPPFFDESPFRIYEKILEGRVDFPRFVDPEAKDLIKKLLTADRTKRLGALRDGAVDVKRHPWFAGIDWDALVRGEYPPPIPVRVQHQGDTHYFERYPEPADAGAAELDAKLQELFVGF
jgi:serine/threonine protein kinase